MKEEINENILRQTRIFVPPESPFDDKYWAETLLGSIITPLISQIKWFWFSRYEQPKNGEMDDCDIDRIPNSFLVNNNFRSIRFRYQVIKNEMENFEKQAEELIRFKDCRISDFRDYDLMKDLGSERFISKQDSIQKKEERVDLISNFLFFTCKIFIHCIEGPDNEKKYHIEKNHQTFATISHLLHNIAGIHPRIVYEINGLLFYD